MGISPASHRVLSAVRHIITFAKIDYITKFAYDLVSKEE